MQEARTQRRSRGDLILLQADALINVYETYVVLPGTIYIMSYSQVLFAGFKYIYASLALSHIQLIRSSEEYGQELVMSWIKSARAPFAWTQSTFQPVFHC
ncbi:hypothetical protein ACFX1X_044358 [Malus domestica]